MTGYPERLGDADSLTDIFRIVKDLVQDNLDRSRAGLMLGLARLGLSPGGYLGGYFVLGSNTIVLNEDVLDHIRAEHPEHHDAYAFNILLHEYLHTVGFLSEAPLRRRARELVEDAFGPEHPATQIAAALDPSSGDRGAPVFFRKLTMPEHGYKPAKAGSMRIVPGFDPDATPYIY